MSDINIMGDYGSQNAGMDDVITEIYLADVSHTNGVAHNNDVAFVNWTTEARLDTCATNGGKMLPVGQTVLEHIAVFIALASEPMNSTDLTTKTLKSRRECVWNAEKKTLCFNVECSGNYELTAFMLGHDRSTKMSIVPRFLTGRHPLLDLTRSYYEFKPYYPKQPEAAPQWFHYVIPGLQSKFLLTFKDELDCVITPAEGSISVTCLEDGKSCDVSYGQSSQEVTLETYEHYSYTICVNGTELHGQPKPIVPRVLQKFDPGVCQVDPDRKLVLCPLEGDSILSVEQCDNIRRVLDQRCRIQERKEDGCCLIFFSAEDTAATATDIELPLNILCELVALVLEGKHYRNQATLHEDLRIFYKTQATMEYNAKRHSLAGICSELKKWHADRMTSSHRHAMESYRTFYNKKREDNQIDLHELRAYTDSRTRQTGEAIEVLEEAIEMCIEAGRFWLEIIVGSGHHSTTREQIIRRAVEERLHELELESAPCNKGALVVRLKPFVGKEPFFGHFYCPECDKLWQSHWCWFDKKSLEHEFYGQLCYKCNEPRFPLKPEERLQPDHRLESKGKSQTRETAFRHLDLCLKCKAIRMSCKTLSKPRNGDKLFP